MSTQTLHGLSPNSPEDVKTSITAFTTFLKVVMRKRKPIFATGYGQDLFYAEGTLKHSGRLVLYRIINDPPEYYFVTIKSFEPEGRDQALIKANPLTPGPTNLYNWNSTSKYIKTVMGRPWAESPRCVPNQFLYLLLNNQEIRDVIIITSNAVLILGRFSPERKIILDRLREELRTRHYVPIMFDFKKPNFRNTVETIRILAGLSKFIIADLTDAKAVVQELQAIVEKFPSVVVRFIIKKSEREPGMFDHIRRFPWVLDGAFEYENPEEVIESINDSILEPVEAKLRELTQ